MVRDGPKRSVDAQLVILWCELSGCFDRTNRKLPFAQMLNLAHVPGDGLTRDST